jgi:LytTr DNA-binding domain
MSAGLEVTSGGRSGTNGRRIWVAGCAVMAGFVVIETVVGAQSLVDDFARMGRSTPPWMPWTWELTSAVGWLTVMPLIALAAVRLRPPRLSWPATVAAHLALTVPVSLLHVGVMTVLRVLVHGLVGDGYGLGSDLMTALVYEWRKDAADYLLIALTFAIIDWTARRADGEAAAPASEPKRLEVRDGSRTIWLAPADILWAEAAGNYVELQTVAGSLLHRTTLAALERELAPHGFARIHRSRLVQRAAVRAVETNASGDFDAVLTDGARLGGSRRYRSSLEA